MTEQEYIDLQSLEIIRNAHSILCRFCHNDKHLRNHLHKAFVELDAIEKHLREDISTS